MNGTNDQAELQEAQDAVQDEVLLRTLATRELAVAAAATHAAAGRSTTAAVQAAAAKAGGAKRAIAAARPQGATVRLRQDSRGLLHWEYSAAGAAATSAGGGAALRGMRRAADAGRGAGEVIASVDVAQVGANQLVAGLEHLDDQLTPERGLRYFDENGQLAPSRPARPGGLAGATRVLLLVHGTFSKGDAYEEQLLATPEGAGFLQDCLGAYSHVVAFDHPTLSVSPAINAFDLEQALRAAGLPPATPIDVVCHSRGGVVVAWWLRTTAFRAETVIAAGSSLHGTSLASPYRIRYFLDYLATYAKYLGKGLRSADAVPGFAGAFLRASGTLFALVGGLVHAASETPLADAAIALVPGLHGQSRITNNLELQRLWGEEGKDWLAAMQGRPVAFHAITSDFEPDADSEWWELGSKLKELAWKAADGVADKVFPAANDLVVDVACMAFPGVQPELVFKGSDAVHHCNYFVQPRTIDALRGWLGV